MAARLRWALGVSVLSCLAAACGDDETGTGGTGAGGGATGGAGGEGGAGGADAGITIEGLDGPVTADVDDQGFFHLHCSTDADCFAAMGYFHAANRFFFMDFVRNSVRGKLGQLVKAGNAVMTQDFDNRRFFTTREGEPLEDALYQNASAKVRGFMDAYARGVNAWIADMRAGTNGATLTTEYDFNLIVKEAIRDWEPQDSAAVGLYVLNDLSNNSGSELEMAAAMPAFADQTLAADLFSGRPVVNAYTVPEALGQPLAPPAPVPFPARRGSSALYRSALDHVRNVGLSSARGAQDIGSNNWAVGPSRTTSGNAILANDPHLALTNPSIWFPIEIDAKTNGTGEFHVAGSTFPGLPSIMVGHNESIGWGVTTAYWDLADVYEEQLTPDGKTVVFEGGTVPIIEKEFTFIDSSADNQVVTQTFRYVPHHGPIVSEDLDAGTAVTIRWRGQDAGTDLDAFFGLATSASVDDAKVAVQSASSASQNFLIVDTAGNIGWFPYSQIPARPWASAALPPWLPLPGDGSAEWGGPVPYEDLPQLENPPVDAIATANQDMTGAYADGDPLNDGQAALQSWSKAEGTRERRILDLLESGGDSHSVASMHAIQGDTYSLYGEVTVPILLAVASTMTLDADQQALVDALTAWDFTCPTGVIGDDPMTATNDSDPDAAAAAIGCTAFHATLYALAQAALGDEIASAGVALKEDRWALHMVARALRDPASLASGESLWDDVSTSPAIETRDDIVARAIADAAAVLGAMGATDDWRWGRVHTLTLRSIYDSFGLKQYNAGPYCAPGGQYTVNVASPSNQSVPDVGDAWSFSFGAGPSVRFVVEADPAGPKMTYELPGGSDLHRESPFYNNLIDEWLANEPVDFPFGADAVQNPNQEILVNPQAP